MSTAELVEKIDDKWDYWNFYRAADKNWVFTAEGASFSNETIEAVLQQAADFVPLPKIPRKPRIPEPYSVQKDGSKWSVYLRGYSVCGNFDTKKKAREVADRFMQQDIDHYQFWMREHSEFVESHTEGIGFRWAE